MSMMHRDALRFVRQHFLDDGTPSATHKKCLEHFKDRFRDAIRDLVRYNGGRATKNATYTLTHSPAGACLEAQVRVEGSGMTRSDVAFAYDSAQRLATPFMREAGFQVTYLTSQHQPVLNGEWEKLMMREGEGLIAAEAWAEDALSEENRAEGLEDVVVRAVMVFHHPTDHLVQEALAAEASGWPEGLPRTTTSWSFSGGGLAWTPPHKFQLWDRSSVKWGRETDQGKLGHQYHILEINNPYDGRGMALVEAASSPRANFQDLKVLADRLQMSTDRWGVDSVSLTEDYLRPALVEPLGAWVSDLLAEGGHFLGGLPKDQPVKDTTDPESVMPEVQGEVSGDFGALSLRLVWARTWEPELVLDVILKGPRGSSKTREGGRFFGGVVKRWRPQPQGEEGKPLNLRDPQDLSCIRKEILDLMLQICLELKEEMEI
jgi:hypothetical protein